MTDPYGDTDRDVLIERIAILENANAALVATLAEREARLAAAARRENAAAKLALSVSRERYLARERASRMHRRAQRAEGILQRGELERLRNENSDLRVHYSSLAKHARRLAHEWCFARSVATLALDEGLNECERLRGILADASKSITWLLGAQAASLDHANKAESTCALALREGLAECERLRAKVEFAERSAVVAFRMLANAEMREEAAKKRAAQLSEALEAVEFGDGVHCCPCCKARSPVAWGCPSDHDEGCIVGIALGRIPAEVSDE